MKIFLSHTFIVFTFACTLTTNSVARDFGPEWTKKTFENSNYVEYQRTLEITATHSGMGNVTNYPIALENNNLAVFEVDDNLGLNIHVRGLAELSIGKDMQGQAESFTIGIGAVRYFDLNGDGYLDARYDGNTEASEIFYEGQYVAVKRTKDGFKLRKKSSADGKTNYVFAEGKWQAVLN